MSFSIFGCKEYNQFDFSIDHLVMSMCRVTSCCWRRVFPMTSVFSWQNSVSLCTDSFCPLRPNFPVTQGLSWLPTFEFPSPIAGVQPQRIQGYPQDDGIGNKESKKGRERGLIFLGLHRKSIKLLCSKELSWKKNRERKEGKKKKRKTWGDQALVSEAPNFIFKSNFYILTCT